MKKRDLILVKATQNSLEVLKHLCLTLHEVEELSSLIDQLNKRQKLTNDIELLWLRAVAECELDQVSRFLLLLQLC